jgi:hypothetical protein
MKKKYFQACELGGSLYGKKREADGDDRAAKKNVKIDNSVNSYKKLFKNQVVVMDKVFRRESEPPGEKG